MSSNRTITAILTGLVLVASACSTSDVPTGVRMLPGGANATTLSDAEAVHDRLVLQLDSVLAVQRVKRSADQALSPSLLGSLLGLVKKVSTNGVKFLTCSTLPYYADAQLLGPAGGTLQMGPHKLRIPAGALDKETLISGEAPRGEVAEVDFAPHGLRFEKSNTLSLSYKHCLIPLQGLLPALFRNAYVVNGAVVEFLPTTTDRLAKFTNSPLDHFSSYMIAY